MRYLDLDEVVNTGGHRFSVNDLYQLQESNTQIAQAICEYNVISDFIDDSGNYVEYHMIFDLLLLYQYQRLR